MAKDTKKIQSKVKDIYIHFILDRSGSMESMWSEVKGGFDKFVSDQKDVGAANSYLSLTTFDTVVETPIEWEMLSEIPTWKDSWAQPRGGTALYDAVCVGLDETDDWVKENDWKGDVVVVVLTDGQENSSQEHKLPDVKARIKRAEDNGVIVSFLASNQDAWETYNSMGGSNVGTTQHYNSGFRGQTQSVIANASAATTVMRGGGVYAMVADIDPASADNEPAPQDKKKDKKVNKS